jgi:hypothetical protein
MRHEVPVGATAGWTFCTIISCECELPKACAIRGCSCSLEKVCTSRTCTCGCPKVCPDPKCNCGYPKAATLENCGEPLFAGCTDPTVLAIAGAVGMGRRGLSWYDIPRSGKLAVCETLTRQLAGTRITIHGLVGGRVMNELFLWIRTGSPHFFMCRIEFPFSTDIDKDFPDHRVTTIDATISKVDLLYESQIMLHCD